MATNNDEEPTREGGSDNDSRIGGQAINGNGTYPFAGLTRYDDGESAMLLPEEVADDTSSMECWAANKVSGTAPGDSGFERDIDSEMLPDRGLLTMLPELPTANHAEAAWIHPRTGEVITTGKHNAVVERERVEEVNEGFGTHAEALAHISGRDEEEVAADLEQMGREEYVAEKLTEPQQTVYENTRVGDDALFQIAGEGHSIINPQQPLEELAHELQDRGFEDDVFGEVTIDRDGGRASLDIYIDGQHVESPVFGDDRNPVVVGLQVQWSFFSDWAFRACGQAIDWACVNNIHRMTNRQVVKYAGDVNERVQWREWFGDILDELDEKRDQLSRVIRAASEETLDFADLPADIDAGFEDEPASPWTALYSYLGLPKYLAREAGKRLRSQADDAYEPNWWEIHSGATWAVSHHDRGDRTAGGSYEDHARTANEMLYNPARMENRVVENYEAARRDDEQTTLADEGGGTAEIHSAFESTREKKERFQQWEQELKEMGVEV